MTLSRFIIPIILLIASAGLFFGFISNGFKEKTALSEEVAVYKDALEKARQLKARQEELDKKLLSIGKENLENLGKILPDNVDTVRVIMDLNGIASKYSILVKSIKISEPKVAVSGAQAGQSVPLASVTQIQSEYDSTTLSFSVATTYEKFKAFLSDLEESLRILDVTAISLKSSEGGATYDFSVTAQTYLLK